MTAIVVTDYDPAWPASFERIRERIAPALSGIALAIEHVGSTSVPGLPAKPILDVDAIVERRHVAEAIERLAPLGYEHVGDLGVRDREAFRHNHATRHNLYVCVAGSSNLRNHLALRDALRSDSNLAREYGELKRRLAARFPDDIDAYVAGKSALILRVLEASGRLTGDELAEIRAINALP
ncbi:MAG TPA: GrpB family protein [Verrucomicrobiae bacterium]|nr:GrpB family protein [Verrucomicrobiae bacterium]